MLSTPLSFAEMPFYRISIKERECDYRDSRTNMFDHFDIYNFDEIIATPKSVLTHSIVSPFVSDYPVMRIFIIPNTEIVDQLFPLRITMTMIYSDEHLDVDPDLEIVRELCGLAVPQFCVSSITGTVLNIFSSLTDLNDFLVGHKLPPVTDSSVQYSSGIELLYRELNMATIMDSMISWMCNSTATSVNHLTCNVNDLVHTKIYADAKSMGVWIDHIVYALYLCMMKAERMDAILDAMLDSVIDTDIDILDEIETTANVSTEDHICIV